MVVALAVVLPGGASAQARPPASTLASDRPGIGTGSYVVAPGVVQLEAGVARSESGRADQYRFGEALVRIGVSGVELRVSPGSRLIRRRGGEDEGGFEDPSLGAKVGVGSMGDGAFQVSALAALGIPWGTEPFTADEFTATVAILGDWSVHGGAAVSFNVQTTTTLDETRNDVWTLTVTPAAQVPGVDGLGAYAGWAGTVVESDTNHQIEAGLTYLLGDDVQLDLNSGWDVQSSDYFLGIGIARRWR